jgi:predicted subunit of tRNA(5-methylaminomethyl-2-thiouridylate) methyltransferase
MSFQGHTQSIKRQKHIEYITLRGFGHKTINNLSENLFEVKKEQTNMEKFE